MSSTGRKSSGRRSSGGGGGGSPAAASSSTSRSSSGRRSSGGGSSSGGGGAAAPASSASRRSSSGRRSSGGGDGAAGEPAADDSHLSRISEEGSVDGESKARSMSKEQRQALVSQGRQSNAGAQKGGASSADVVFMVDCTQSMEPYAKAVAQTVSEVLAGIQEECGGVQCRAGILAYRDHCESKADRYEVTGLTDNIDDVSDKMSTLADGGCFGGGDGPEDVHGAINEVLAPQMGWESDARIVVHIADAPCHGTQFHDPCRDDHPDGFKGWDTAEYDHLDPNDMTAEALLGDMVLEGISYCFLRITPHTEKMLGVFRDIYRTAARGHPSCHFTVADLGNAPAEGDRSAEWKEFTARFASLMRGTIKDSVMSGGMGGKASTPLLSGRRSSGSGKVVAHSKSLSAGGSMMKRVSSRRSGSVRGTTAAASSA
jgi:hypothetical protein